ncbi:hypothetical protein SIN09_27680, partial [Streptomyces sp. F8]|uniref:hypothetical protein n=1 Tax=Streptomyces sp. F8 TaxID=1436085 RepID=UPI0029D2F911
SPRHPEPNPGEPPPGAPCQESFTAYERNSYDSGTPRQGEHTRGAAGGQPTGSEGRTDPRDRGNRHSR